MISKELLSEVLEDEYNDRLVDWFQIEDNYLRTYYDCGRYDCKGRPTGLGIEINIYELANKCKEWAYKSGYTLLPHKIEKYPKSSYLTLVESIDFAWDDLILSPNRKIKVEEFFAGTEPEAIFKACQWILDQKEN